MTLYYGNPIISNGYGGAYTLAAPAPAGKAADPDDKVKPAEALERPQASPAMGMFPGFGKAPPPSASIFWQMRKYSACALAFAVTAGPIFAGTRQAVVRDADGENPGRPPVPTGIGAQVLQSPADKRRKLCEDVFEHQWPDILNGLECLNFGHWLQEVVWERARGVTAPVKFKSFLPGEAHPHRDKFNEFAGFKYGTTYRDGRYAWNAVCSEHFDPIFGLPRAENAREPWWRAMQSQENGDRIERKASGIQMFIEAMSGLTFGDGTTVEQALQTIVNAAQSGKTFTAPLLAFTKESIQGRPELAEIPAMRVKQFDWGNTGPSLLAAVSRLDRLDKEIFRSWHRPEREAMEGTHGTKAEAGVHGQVGLLDSELIHASILRQFNRQVLNPFLVTNFGPGAADSIYFKPAPLADPQQAFKQEVAMALLSNPGSGPAAQANVDVRGLLKGTELPLVPEGQVVTPPPADPNAPGGTAGNVAGMLDEADKALAEVESLA